MGYLIGIDGGATGTVGFISKPDGTILDMAKGPASNYYIVGRDGAREALAEVIHTLLERQNQKPEDCEVAMFGLSALNHPSDLTAYQEEIAKIGLGGQMLIENDILVAWAGATNAQPGIVVIAGTGSSAFGVNAEGEMHKTLGWDFKLGDQGSGYWIGQQGLLTAMKAYDGRIAQSLLLDAMIAHFELQNPEEIIQKAYAPNFEKGIIAGFAKAVTQCAQNGDEHAQAILHRAGEELGLAVVAVAQKLKMTDDAFPLGLIGGAFRAEELLLASFRKKVNASVPGAHIQEAKHGAAVGALILGQYRLGTLTDEFLANVDATDNPFARQARWKSA